MTLTDILHRLEGVSGSGKQYSARCPAHDDRHASLSVSEGNDGKILFNCHAGCAPTDITAALGIKMSDLFQMRREAPQSAQSSKPVIVATYQYKASDGSVLCEKVRLFDKDKGKKFYWRQPDGCGGWINNARGIAKPLYNWENIPPNSFVFLVEGEKDVDTLKSLGVFAVSLPDGAKTKKWLDEYTEFFTHRDVCVVQDNDTVGKQFAQEVAGRIYGHAISVKILDLSQIWADIPEKGDVSDYVAAFPNDRLDKVLKLYSDTPPWTPEAAEQVGILALSDVESTKTEWLWYPYIPRGKITLLTADPGTGKTFFCLYLAAAVSTGRPFYGQNLTYRSPEKAVYQTAEDGIADTIKPRLEPMSPNFKNIIMIDESEKGLSLSDERIERIMKQFKPALMIFDPLQAYLGADVDMNRANQVRPILAHIAKLAETYNTAVVFIMHNSKMGQNKALYRPLGSIDIPAVSRSMLILGKDPEDESRKILCHEKSSLAAHGQSIVFKIEPSLGGITFCGFSDLRADDILNPIKGKRDKPSVRLDEAVEQLNELLGEEGYANYKDVQTLQVASGMSISTLKNAKQYLQLQTVKIGFDKQVTYWLSPDIDKEDFKLSLRDKAEIEEHRKDNVS